jgi:hypothetical protein
MFIPGHRAEYLVGVEHGQGILWTCNRRTADGRTRMEITNPHDGKAVAGRSTEARGRLPAQGRRVHAPGAYRSRERAPDPRPGARHVFRTLRNDQ